MTQLGFAPVAAEDFEALLALRIRAMRPALEALGRFDPERARARFLGQFEPEAMRWVMRDGARVGLLTLRKGQQPWHLRHMYLEPEAQGQAVGAWVIGQAQQEAAAAGAGIALEALRGSAANRFYQRHGFAGVAEDELECSYRWEPRP
ncbi:GNAT family N-acetyltransferase [Inhella proteolytica]|uniref:GNAT family N-acetyltransferase n=1 Tax=Inhella proteolytica TaxID=2795029 RepID=A0A931ND82_9BURK|nr:GNAT family N-acetyltransferase [Inhella proteolytica]MBH9576392.1 GNAT family N-acetyltransferase [Inhella proteolytica]